jgi:hypothetical protein
LDHTDTDLKIPGRSYDAFTTPRSISRENSNVCVDDHQIASKIHVNSASSSDGSSSEREKGSNPQEEDEFDHSEPADGPIYSNVDDEISKSPLIGSLASENSSDCSSNENGEISSNSIDEDESERSELADGQIAKDGGISRSPRDDSFENATRKSPDSTNSSESSNESVEDSDSQEDDQSDCSEMAT